MSSLEFASESTPNDEGNDSHQDANLGHVMDELCASHESRSARNVLIVLSVILLLGHMTV